MTPKELESLAEEAKARYETLYDVMKEVFSLIPEEVIKKYYPENSQDIFLENFDLLYQLALLKIALADRSIQYNEIVFLRMISRDHVTLEGFFKFAVEHGTPSKIRFYEDLEKSTPEECEAFIQMQDVAFENIRLDFFSAMGEIQTLNKKNYYQIFKDCTKTIVHALLNIDEVTSKEETEKASEILYTMFFTPLKKALIPNVKMEIKNLKTICQQGRHYKSLKELYRIRKPLVKRTTAHLVNYRTDSNLLEQATIYIETDNSTGSGFIISPDGRCVTCAHVVKGVNVIFARVTLENGDKEIHKCRLLEIDEKNDFAIIQLETPNQYFFEVQKDYRPVKLGRSIAIFGYPFGVGLSDEVLSLAPTITKGYISSRQIKDGTEYYFLDAQARPGNSGGPVLDTTSGKVIGYLCGAYGDQQNKIVYMRSLKPHLDKLRWEGEDR